MWTSKPLLKALLLHKSLNPCGGAEKVAISFLSLLKEMGFKTQLVTLERTDWAKVYRHFNYDPNMTRPDRERALGLNRLSIYKRFLVSLYATIAHKSFNVSVSTYFEAIRGLVDIGYLHSPNFILHTRDKDKYYESMKWFLYYVPYEILNERILDRIFLKNPIILTNSKFTQTQATKILNIRPLVVYPPVDSRQIIETSQKMKKKKEPIVVTLSRIVDYKRLEIIPDVARLAKNAKKFIILGGIQDSQSYRICDIIERKAKQYSVNLEIFPITHFEQKVEILSKAKVYFHPMPNEQFGISIVEAMACGCIPVVHKSGGPWHDILNEKEDLGRTFQTIDEATHAIDELLSMPEHMIKKYSDEVILSSLKYDVKRFKSKVSKIINTFHP